MLDGGADGGALAAVAAVANHLNYVWVQPGEFFQSLRRAIGGTVIDRYDLDGHLLPQRYRQQARDQRRQVFRFVEDRDEDRDSGLAGTKRRW